MRKLAEAEERLLHAEQTSFRRPEKQRVLAAPCSSPVSQPTERAGLPNELSVAVSLTLRAWITEASKHEAFGSASAVTNRVLGLRLRT